MECLLTGTRHWLRSPVFQLRSFPVGTDPSFALYRQYVLAPTPRRMNGHGQSDQPNTPASLEETANSHQAHPLSGYYSLILNSSSPYRGGASTSRPTPARPEAKPTPASTVAPQTPQERMAIVFGSPLTGPGRTSRYNPGEIPPESTWKTINGVPIPPQPEEPDNCCMSGCVHCVWDDYRDEMEDWASRITMAQAKGGPEKGTRDMRSVPRAEVNAASGSMDDDGGGSETNWALPPEHNELFAKIPVGIREFMKTEKRLRVKREHEGTATV